MTARGHVSYTVACELSKLQTTPSVLKEEIEKLFSLARTKFDTWQKMRKIIQEFRKNKTEEKNSLFGILDENESKKYLQAVHNRIDTYVTQSVWGAFLASGNLLKKALEAFENGTIDYDYSPLLKQGLRKFLRVNIENFQACLNHLKKTRKKLLKKTEWKTAEKILEETKDILEKTEMYTHA